MQGIRYYRDAQLPFFELKLCDVSGLCYKKHSHEEYSLGMVEIGSSSFWYDGRNTVVGPKNFVLIPPGLIHACNPLPDIHWQYKMLFIAAGWLRKFLEGRKLPLLGRPLVNDKVKPGCFQRLCTKLTSLANPLDKETAVLAFFEQATQGMGAQSRDNRINVLPKLAVIREYLQDNYRQRITLDELEQISGLNKFSIIRSFKEEFHIPPHMYQTLLRINDAKKMLRQSRPIIEVAYETGFYDQSHFQKVFKSHTGVTPEKYRN